MNSEDYAKLVESTEKILEEVDKEILKISDAALKSQKLGSGDYLDLMRLRMSMSEYLKDVRTDFMKERTIEELRKEYAEFAADYKERAKASLIRYTSAMSDESIKASQKQTEEWVERHNQELADRILEIKLSPL